MRKSNMDNKYETACYVQEAAVPFDTPQNGYIVRQAINGKPFCEFDATLMTFNVYNRMQRRYDAHNIDSVIASDQRITELKRRNEWRGEWNHPNPEIKGQIFSDIRMTIPEPSRTSHIISKNRLEGDRYRAHITTDPGTDCGVAVATEIVDLHTVPAFSVRLLGNMIPNAPMNQPNMRVTKVITFDMVDYPSHEGAEADITPVYQEAAVTFLKELAQYCCEQDENMRVVCESFQFSKDDIMGINNGDIVIEQADTSKILIPLRGKIRTEALSILTNEGGF